MINWNTEAQEKFDQMIDKVPTFLRNMAKEKVLKTAIALAEKENRSELNEKDLVDSFFEATPFGFHGPMKTDMKDLNIDYVQYGYEE